MTARTTFIHLFSWNLPSFKNDYPHLETDYSPIQKHALSVISRFLKSQVLRGRGCRAGRIFILFPVARQHGASLLQFRSFIACEPRRNRRISRSVIRRNTRTASYTFLFIPLAIKHFPSLSNTPHVRSEVIRLVPISMASAYFARLRFVSSLFPRLHPPSSVTILTY